MGLFLVFGSDAFGESLKDSLVKHCQAKGHQVEDLGTGAYYEIAGEVAKRVGREREGKLVKIYEIRTKLLGAHPIRSSGRRVNLEKSLPLSLSPSLSFVVFLTLLTKCNTK